MWFSSDFAILQPTEQQGGNHRILFDVVNRGRKTALAARIGLAPIAVQRSDMTAAPELLSDLESLRGTMSGAFAWAMSIDRLIGLLSHTMGNLAQANGYFEDALAFCRKAGYRPELAWTCCDYSDTLACGL